MKDNLPSKAGRLTLYGGAKYEEKYAYHEWKSGIKRRVKFERKSPLKKAKKINGCKEDRLAINSM